ncbi:MAG TPA: DNA polymerase ligase N-terminal domain-containing protein [Thermodesulfobacteriota bacterium]|nr:DNA polymerase ligase N-terminal domain-containing protein [Thermodesulfobacteriota bacterium]
MVISLRFVVHEHDASRLHYDFRLERDGVLRSWAVPKGPSMDPSEKRLAVQVEDHPLEYIDFRGTIPEGKYGAGRVAIWDHGAYTLLEEKGGEIKFSLEGEKLRGSFVLVKLKRSKTGKDWLLIKHKDEFAQPGWKLKTSLPRREKG